jgi:hypothetical protein
LSALLERQSDGYGAFGICKEFTLTAIWRLGKPGGFTAVFFVQCLVAIGAHVVRLHEAD